MNLDRRVILLAAAAAVVALLELTVFHFEHHGDGVYFPGMFALVSVASGIVMIVGAKLLARYWLERWEDYYD